MAEEEKKEIPQEQEEKKKTSFFPILIKFLMVALTLFFIAMTIYAFVDIFHNSNKTSNTSDTPVGEVIAYESVQSDTIDF